MISFSTNSWNRVRYRLLAPIYDFIVSRLDKHRRRSLELAEIQPGERVLLLGAGTGLDLPLLPHGCSITAIDITPAMIERLGRRARELDLSVDARVMDGQALDLATASFDVVVLHLILAVIPDPYRCIREAARVLKPDGRAVIFDKFIPDGSRAPLILQLLQPIASLIGTELNRRLGPMLEAAGWVRRRDEAALLGGFFRIVVAQPAGAIQW